MKIRLLQICCALLALTLGAGATAYEINNHADMSETATVRSVLQLYAGQPERETKLFKLGLKAFSTTAEEQTFPLGAGLGPIPYCYGSERPDPWKVTTTAIPPQQAGETMEQPNWVGGTLTIAQMIRYGACYEDEEEPFQRSISHFYNPQDQGAGAPFGPNSLEWMLKRNPGSNLKSGDNHYTWMDARDSFYKALTARNPALFAYQDAEQRRIHWGKTFQALGHIVHHLQDMGSPQHVRADYHCNSVKDCDLPVIGPLLYRPSGYEMHFERQVAFVRGLASTATTPMMFGLPREFWNVNTDDNLGTNNLSAPAAPTDGIAAYTSSNFTSAAKDYYVSKPLFGPATFRAPAAAPFPQPSGQWEPAKIADLYPPEQASVAQYVVNTLCEGDAEKCKMYFMGTALDSAARTSSMSVFAQKILRPANAFAVEGPGVFQQNYWTYNDGARKLVPKAVEYSAGLINYFFRGDFSIRPPEEGLYGLLDGGDTNSNCKDTCGFRKIRARVTNTTAPINGAVQDMTSGTLTAVVKFSRNSCYQPDWSGDIGELGTISPEQRSGCYLGGGAEPVEEIVLSQPINVTQLAVGAEQDFTFDFTANVIPINAWNIKLQVVFRGTLGAEPNAVAVSTVQVSAPTVIRYINETDWMDIDQHIYRTTVVDNTESLLAALEIPSCIAPPGPYRGVTVRTLRTRDENGNFLYDAAGMPLVHDDWDCYPEREAIRSNWRSRVTGTLLATSKPLYKDTQSVLVFLGGLETGVVPFDITYPPTASFPQLQLPTREVILDTRVLQWNAATPEIESNQFWSYRGMHTSLVTAAFWAGRRAIPTTPSWQELKSRPPISSPSPIPFNFIDPRYQ